ncbi:hypothetical protein EN829_015080 [Mesorhizobium sp. M00.F.Ca.ET.186.01.1.1]|nr:hypothetical protein EN848_14355 [bacterium M00.F.Ca.ET.205.01.1.1]TGU53004.1 hypothetical protein EN795_15040 [bacterium M00.F.Ca.ET.152.01.1.1]TGV35973.1 hypothetical protein EN829_015080 [Mesorhizobium sp. M00.F.Ca.ET.186.01.1.1]TGZ43556.1 hypothetical protein EN805_10650 [bacterium M00.F.Ca.ET.162.01.1.1]
MAIILRSVKGSNLTPAEVDGNFTDLDGRVTEIEDNPPAAVGISNITVDGTQMTIYLEDATVLGPYTLPQGNFRPSIVGALDVPTDGVYTVTSNADFNRYWRYDGSSDATIELPATATSDLEVSFRQVGAGVLLFPDSTDVVVNGYEGYLNQTAGPGSVVTCKFVEEGVWDLIGRLAEDVTA